jgi:hypothetical protein
MGESWRRRSRVFEEARSHFKTLYKRVNLQ